MKRVIIATNNRDLAERSIKRADHDPNHPALHWVESDADADKLLAMNWRGRDTRFTVRWYTGQGLKGPSDDKMSDMVSKFGFMPVRSSFRWLDA